MRLWTAGALLTAPVIFGGAVAGLILLTVTSSGTVLAGAAAAGQSQSCSTNSTTAATNVSFGNATGATLAAKAAQAAGFTGNDLMTAVAVAGAESGYRPAVRNSIGASGLWQILESAHRDLWSMGDWRDPAVNARMAFSVWKAAGRRWTPWTTWTGGSYARYMPDAQRAVSALGVAVTAVSVACVQPATFTTGLGGPSPAMFDQLGNPRTVAQAMSWAQGMVGVGVPVGACAHYVALAYGWANSGSATALALWQSNPASGRHTGAAPRGALMFWSTGNPAGHVAISDGAGGVYSTDVSAKGWTPGVYGHVPQKVIDQWGAYLGWTAPIFPGHVGRQIIGRAS